MFEESVLHEDFKTYCGVTSSFKCKGADAEWADSYGIGDTCDEAQAHMFEVYKDYCAVAGEGAPIFGTANWRCSCDLE
jgi:hypothetical protein